MRCLTPCRDPLQVSPPPQGCQTPAHRHKQGQSYLSHAPHRPANRYPACCPIHSRAAMARRPRILIAHQPHHVVQRGHRQRAVFDESDDYCAYLEDLHDYRQSLGVALYAWCLMPNHVHLLLAPQDDPRTVSMLMQRIAQRATRRWNARRDVAGSLWEARFKSRVIDTERYLLACCMYIELNPVRAGLSASASEYRWSSYRARMGIVSDKRLDLHDLYVAMGPDQQTRRKEYEKWCLSHTGV